MLCAHNILNIYRCAVRVCVCVHSESDIWHISQDELPATPKIKPTKTTTKAAAETANALLKLSSLSCPCRHTHTHTRAVNFPSIRARISPAFGTWYLALGTLVAACCSRFSSPWMLDSCASCLAASQKSKKRRNSPFWNRVGILLLRPCWIIFEKKKVLSANFFSHSFLEWS